MGWNLQWRSATAFSVECPGLAPDQVAALPAEAVARLPVRVGRESADLADLFSVEWDGSRPPDRLEIRGEMPNLHRLAERMAGGSLVVRGSVGSFLALEMRGGTVDLDGSAGAFAGASMRDGRIRIRGWAGDDLGSALPGDRLGMRGGSILVLGESGDRVGRKIRRGLIAVSGRVGDDLGHRMIAGTILAAGGVGRRAGSGMKRGTLLLLGPDAPAIEPGFAPACRVRPPFVSIYRKWLADHGFDVPSPIGPLLRYNGDSLENGRGELLVADDREADF